MSEALAVGVLDAIAVDEIGDGASTGCALEQPNVAAAHVTAIAAIAAIAAVDAIAGVAPAASHPNPTAGVYPRDAPRRRIGQIWCGVTDP